MLDCGNLAYLHLEKCTYRGVSDQQINLELGTQEQGH